MTQPFANENIQLISVYNKIAKDYYRLREHMALTEEIDEFCSYLSKGASILDAGCGNGRDSMIFYGKGYQVTAIDYSDEQLEVAKKRDGIEHIDLQKQNLLCLRFSEASFDGIWCCAVLPHFHFTEIVKILTSFHQILKKYGILCFSLKQGCGEEYVKEPEFPGIERYTSFYSHDDIEKLALLSGFKILKTSTYNERKKFAAENRDLNFIVSTFMKV